MILKPCFPKPQTPSIRLWALGFGFRVSSVMFWLGLSLGADRVTLGLARRLVPTLRRQDVYTGATYS